MFEEVERVRERRRERMERIRAQMRESMPPYANDWTKPYEDEDWTGGNPFAAWRDPEPSSPLPPQTRLKWQVAGSLLLVGGAYLLFQTNHALPASWKAGAQEVLSRDFNFAGAAAWYQERFGRLPSILPAFSPRQAVPVQGQAEHKVWRIPADWRVVQPFDPAHPRMVVAVAADSPVLAGETGWVAYVGDKPDFGLTVVVRLSGGREIWYGHLASTTLAANDWIQKGDAVGEARKGSHGEPLLYLAMREREQFINPLDVIKLE